MSAPPRVLFLGGNGHATERLDGVHTALRVRAPLPFELIDTPYPGFEDRPPEPDFDLFVARLEEHHRSVDPQLVYGTGIGGLLALFTRLRGEVSRPPLILQGAVLWGLEKRLFPKVMRACPPLLDALKWAFRQPHFQRRFAGKHFEVPPTPGTREAFFGGYARCSAFADLFDWLTPAFLRELEERAIADPGALENITIWWGAHDHVVTQSEIDRTEEALGVRFERVVQPTWGHYPMIDDPAGWTDALAHELPQLLALPPAPPPPGPTLVPDAAETP